ncbi:Flavorubredoxin [Methanococcoides vulcani]|uniref:Flavorubredoxin n=1 Tax=Methanococcoides vulcani TaxID=1353158 RepID=A0A1I0BCG9_9EURY|nr:FprA family A-type flavoprotein [Methanococcoides vulcani]SET04465.1 Flavorubredoxin [Methanococcoides vulcani]
MGPKDENLEIAKGIYWVGVVDWNLRDFHGYATPKGGTYNAYLIVDEKITLIDTVKAEFAPEMIERIRRIVNPSKIDYVISNHVEMDHSSGLPAIMELAKDAKVFCTKHGKTGLNEHYGAGGCRNWDFEVVDTGYELDIGSRTLMFIETPMLHWPDSMQTYLKGDKILFSNDAFGQHLATSVRFEDEVEGGAIEDAAIYYANILMPFGSKVLKYAEKIADLGLEFDMIAPAHGVIWREDPSCIVEAYLRWAKREVIPKVLVIYDTMWNSTEIMAKEILEGVREGGVEAKLFHLRKNDWSMMLKELMFSPVIALGSPTMHGTMFFTVSGFLTYLKGLRPKDKSAVAFGSYGWGGGAVKGVEEMLKSSGFDITEPGLQVKYRPYEDDLKACRDLGIRLAELALNKAN